MQKGTHSSLTAEPPEKFQPVYYLSISEYNASRCSRLFPFVGQGREERNQACLAVMFLAEALVDVPLGLVVVVPWNICKPYKGLSVPDAEAALPFFRIRI
jgi:hypothetical protein